MDVKEVADKLCDYFKSKGFVVQRYNSYTTSSVYIKLDYGLCNSIRVGDHKGKKKYQYRYQIRTDIDKSYTDKSKKYPCHVYAVKDGNYLIKDVIKAKREMLYKYGHMRYRDIMEINKAKNEGSKGFWSMAKLV